MAQDDNFPTSINKNALAIIRMPDGKEYEIALPAKTFSSGREGFYAQVPPLYTKMRFTEVKSRSGGKQSQKKKHE